MQFNLISLGNGITGELFPSLLLFNNLKLLYFRYILTRMLRKMDVIIK